MAAHGYPAEQGYRVRNSGDSVPDTHRRFAWCCQYLYPEGMQVTGYGRLPISGQGLCQAFLGVLSASSEAGGEKESLVFGCG
jgi:hypothetical protein